MIIGIISLISLGAKKTDLIGSLNESEWERTIAIEQFGPVEKDDWQDQIPSNAQMGSCSDKVRDTSDTPSGNSVEVCGAPYKVDKGTVWQKWCRIANMKSMIHIVPIPWMNGYGEALVAKGSGSNVSWPALSLDSTQRESGRSERYILSFLSSGDYFSYETSDYQLYQKAQPGSSWKLIINGFGDVVSIEPAN